MQQPLALNTPLTTEGVEKLRAGQPVLLSGVIYTARDAAHKRMIESLRNDEPLPFALQGQVIYYVGPTPAKDDRPLGAAGPTSSYRMDPYTPELIASGLKAMIGKGARDRKVREALQKFKAVYFAAIGGAGALISRCIVSAAVVAYPDLGSEAVRRLEVKNFPAVVANDAYGGDLYEEGVRKYARSS
jgi:fumarate hydratase subunit beta